ncbi:MAG: SAM-dependent methyltransferase [Alphaproteobacteria bacterium]|nr:SAM-dependent methyltransferase [Alphaproteobacteria bacterium]
MLENLLHQEIKEKGPLSQSRFMELALYHPTHGYYGAQETVGQDFTTSPEISQVFGELIGAWAIDYYEKLGQPPKLSLVELGPGKGTMMADFLRMAKVSPSFAQALNIYMVEINPLLKSIQQSTIPHSLNYVEKFEQIPENDSPIIIIANEFFDVLPTNCYVRKENVLYEKCIDLQDDQLCFTLIRRIENKGPDQTWEESPGTLRLMKEISTRLLKQKGAFLCIDYGYEEGSGDSLQALFKREPSQPLSHIGKSDLTCHINFGRLREISLLHHLGVKGPLPQGRFLKNMGFGLRMEMLKHKNPSQKESLEIGATRLTHPQQMGALFKVMAVFSPASLLPIGFEE